METFKKHGVCDKAPLEEVWRVAGRARVGVKWVDANKGDKEKPEYRCRLVAKEIKMGKREEKKSMFSLFASTPEMRLGTRRVRGVTDGG